MYDITEFVWIETKYPMIGKEYSLYSFSKQVARTYVTCVRTSEQIEDHEQGKTLHAIHIIIPMNSVM